MQDDARNTHRQKIYYIIHNFCKNIFSNLQYMYCLEREREKDDDTRCCHICKRIIKETGRVVIIDGYKTKYYHNECYKYIWLFGNF
jgi:hypothetical protein